MMSGRHRTGRPSIAVLLVATMFVPQWSFAQQASSNPATPAATATSAASAAPAAGAPAAPAPPPAGATSPVAGSPPSAPGPAAASGGPAAAPHPGGIQNGMFGFLADDLSPWGMFLKADLVVKAVICGLIFGSIVTWTVWLAKTIELAAAKRPLRQAGQLIAEAPNLTFAAAHIATHNHVIRAMVSEAGNEWRRSLGALGDRDGLKERVALHLERVEASAGRRMMLGTGVLATIGSTAPFVGLFGTVWGIMNSFIGISRLHTTNLAVVAPGIAEALLATACGLVAAIPAVVIYNHFVRQIAGYRELVANASAAVMALVSRDLSLGDQAIADAVRSETAPAAPAENHETPASVRMVAG